MVPTNQLLPGLLTIFIASFTSNNQTSIKLFFLLSYHPFQFSQIVIIHFSLVRIPAYRWSLTLHLYDKLIFLICFGIWLVSSRSHNFLIIAQLTCGIAGYDYQSVRRWTTFKKLGYGLAECEKVMLLFFLNYFIPSFFLFTCLFPIFNLLLEFIIQIFIPVHRDVHWCLAIINMKDKTFQYLDSLGGLGHDVLNVLVSLTTKQNVTLLLEYSV